MVSGGEFARNSDLDKIVSYKQDVLTGICSEGNPLSLELCIVC